MKYGNDDGLNDSQEKALEEDEEEIFLKDWATMHFDILGEEAGFHKQGSVIMG